MKILVSKKSWKTKIKKATEDAGTYRPYFDSVIDTLSGIMEMRDNAYDLFLKSGGNTVVKHTNQGGSTNLVKNPMLVVVLDCNAQALAYWRDLGLTPKGLKAIDEQAMKKIKKSGLAEVLKKLEND